MHAVYGKKLIFENNYLKKLHKQKLKTFGWYSSSLMMILPIIISFFLRALHAITLKKYSAHVHACIVCEDGH